jgi:hypothetical protein
MKIMKLNYRYIQRTEEYLYRNFKRAGTECESGKGEYGEAHLGEVFMNS